MLLDVSVIYLGRPRFIVIPIIIYAVLYVDDIDTYFESETLLGYCEVSELIFIKDVMTRREEFPKE